MYHLLGFYRNTSVLTKAMMSTVIMFFCLVLASFIDLGRIWSDFVDYSDRAENYVSTLPLLTANGIWFTGFGFAFVENLNRFRTVGYLDSFYLYTLLETGLVGFMLLIGTILRCSKMYFRNTKYMTKFHRMAGGLLAVMLWCGLFETKMYGNDAVDMLNWILLIAATNERYYLIRKHRLQG